MTLAWEDGVDEHVETCWTYDETAPYANPALTTYYSKHCLQCRAQPCPDLLTFQAVWAHARPGQQIPQAQSSHPNANEGTADSRLMEGGYLCGNLKLARPG